jgi:hypothetical protein
MGNWGKLLVLLGNPLDDRISLFSILWCRWRGYHLQDELVRFGDKKDMKFEKQLAYFYIFGNPLELKIDLLILNIIIIIDWLLLAKTPKKH